MDPLITVSKAHKKIYELTNMYEKILQGVNSFSISEYVKSLNKLFIGSVIPHFEFEEKEIFPAVISNKDSGFVNAVFELLQEHRKILEKLAQINTANTNLANNPNASRKEKDELLASCTEIAGALVDHAQKEDTSFYPFLTDIMFNIQ